MDQIPNTSRGRSANWPVRVYDIELSRELTTLEGDFTRWRRGEITALDVSEAVHRFHDGPGARPLSNIHAVAPKGAMAYAIQNGILDEHGLLRGACWRDWPGRSACMRHQSLLGEACCLTTRWSRQRIWKRADCAAAQRESLGRIGPFGIIAGNLGGRLGFFSLRAKQLTDEELREALFNAAAESDPRALKNALTRHWERAIRRCSLMDNASASCPIRSLSNEMVGRRHDWRSIRRSRDR